MEETPQGPSGPRLGMRAVALAVAAAVLGTPVPAATQANDVKAFHGRELKDTTYKGISIRYFLEHFTVSRQQLANVAIDAKPAEMQRYVELMGEGRMPDPSTYIRCDVHMFEEGDKEKWIYRRVGTTWVAQRVFHPSRKARARPRPDEKLLEGTPNGEIIIEGPLPQFASPEEYVRWMAIRVSLAKESETPLGQFLPMVKHVVVSE